MIIKSSCFFIHSIYFLSPISTFYQLLPSSKGIPCLLARNFTASTNDKFSIFIIKEIPSPLLHIQNNEKLFCFDHSKTGFYYEKGINLYNCYQFFKDKYSDTISTRSILSCTFQLYHRL